MKNKNELCNKIFLTIIIDFSMNIKWRIFSIKINIGDSSIFVFSELPVK